MPVFYVKQEDADTAMRQEREIIKAKFDPDKNFSVRIAFRMGDWRVWPSGNGDDVIYAVPEVLADSFPECR